MCIPNIIWTPVFFFVSMSLLSILYSISEQVSKYYEQYIQSPAHIYIEVWLQKQNFHLWIIKLLI